MSKKKEEKEDEEEEEYLSSKDAERVAESLRRVGYHVEKKKKEEVKPDDTTKEADESKSRVASINYVCAECGHSLGTDLSKHSDGCPKCGSTSAITVT